jgi:hypothetical protein
VADQTSFKVIVDPGDADAAELDEMTRSLRKSLLESEDVIEANLVSGRPSPEGAKGIDPGILSAVAVSLVSSGAPVLVSILKDWYERRQPRATLKLEGPNGATIEYPGVSEPQIAEILRRWSAESGSG